MNELPGATPVPGPTLSQEDLTAALSGLEPGDYRTRDLLPRMNAWLEREGRKPVTAKTLGEEIARRSCVERRRAVGNVRMWRLTREGLECRNWFTEPGRS